MHMGVGNLERRRITMEAEKKERRKNREQDNNTALLHVCSVFSQIGRSGIGLSIHQRTHRA